MKVVAFNGSPRKGGNTEWLLKKVLAPIEKAGIETELIQVGGEPIAGCRACYLCAKKKNKCCAVETDKLNKYLAKMIAADGIVLGSPTYFGDLTPEIKALIDRAGFVARSNGGLFRRKIGAGVVAQRRGGAVHTLHSLIQMFLINQMIVPGSTYWNFGIGREKGDVKEDKEAAENMKDLGETIAWLIKSLRQAI